MNSFTTSSEHIKPDGIRSESTPKSILKKTSKSSVKGRGVNFSPTKEVKNFKDYFDSTDDDINESVPLELNLRSSQKLDKEEQKLIHKILTDSNIPYVLSLYLQLLFNIIIIGLICYFIVIFVTTIQSDINYKLELYITDSLQETSKCSREYYRNKCNESPLPPVLENQCTNWMKCMNRDPQLIGRSKLTAETFADILNGFIKPISWKSMVFLGFMIFGSVFITNMAFNSYRHSTNIKLDQLESTIKKQNAIIDNLKAESFTGRDSYNELSISSPLVKKNLGS